jgi:hydrogenase 3 maturation protease
MSPEKDKGPAEELRQILGSGPYLIVGIGNAERGDDGIGSYVISMLNTERKMDCGPVPENYTSTIRKANAKVIILIDAVDFGGKPGERILTEAENAGGMAISTHALPLSIFCKLLPDSKIYLLGIQPEGFSNMSPAAKRSAEMLADELNSILL